MYHTYHMVSKKLKVTLLHEATDPFYSGEHSDNTTYEFLVSAMQRNQTIDYTVLPIQHEYDAYAKLHGKTDAVILSACRDHNIPKITGLKKLNVPILARCGDFHDAPRYGTGEQNYIDYGIDCMFNFMTGDYFYRYYPKKMNYRTILFGVEPSLYTNLTPFKDRLSSTILNSGAVERNTALWHRTGRTVLRYARDVVRNPEKLPFHSRLLHPRRSAYHYYKLRSDCHRLDYVTRASSIKDHIQMPYPCLLSRYRAAMAATTFYPTIKYWEIAAAGCLVFMEITDTNHGAYLGFQDRKTCIIINDNNYKKRFEEYLADPDDMIWKEIAVAGRAYALQNFNNDKASHDIVELIREFS